MVQQYTAAAVGGAGISKSFTYVYDTRHQLAQVHESGNAFTGAYLFKPSGRFDRVTVGAAPLSGSDVKPRDIYYEYNASDPEAVSRLRNASDGSSFATYQYDTAGNLTSRTYASPAATWSFVYDGEDQLRRATQSGVGTEEYFYDHTGARVGIVKRNASNAITEVRYFHGGDTEVWLSPTGSDYRGLRLRVDGHADRPRRQLGQRPRSRIPQPALEPAADDRGVQHAHRHCLERLRLRAVRRAGADVPEHVVSRGTVANVPCHRRRFNDKYVDELDSLSYYGARYYDPVSLTWTQPDPAYRFTKDAAWNEPRRANLYDFDLHNPITLIDPDGRWPGAVQNVLVNAAIDAQWSNAIATMNAASVGMVQTTRVAAEAAARADREATVNRSEGIENESNSVAGAFGGQVLEGALNVIDGKAPIQPLDLGPAVPSPFGRKGSAAHQAEVEAVRQNITNRGLTPRDEVRVQTPGGQKENRYADTGAYDGDNLVELHQVGKTLKDGVTPVKRERDAIDDIKNSEDGKDVPVFFHPYDSNDPSKKKGE